MSRRQSVQVAAAWVCILTGASIYLLFRSRQHLGFYLLDSVGLGSTVDALRSLTEDIRLPDFIRYCLPDGLWTTSYILFADHMHHTASLRSRALWASIIPVVGIGSEALQYFGIIPGMFDIWDLFVYSLPYAAYIVICNL